jgi:outer membrane protein
MKNLSKLFLVVSLLMAGMISLNAQQLKLGHINTQELIAAMPESDTAQQKMQQAMKQLETELERMQVEFNNKYEDYVTNMETYSDLIRQSKETELQEMNQRIQQFQANAEQDLQQQRQKLFKPILDKANEAIAEVAQENGFTYIFDSGSGVLLFTSDNSKDIMSMVKEKMGLN